MTEHPGYPGCCDRCGFQYNSHRADGDAVFCEGYVEPQQFRPAALAESARIRKATWEKFTHTGITSGFISWKDLSTIIEETP